MSDQKEVKGPDPVFVAVIALCGLLWMWKGWKWALSAFLAQIVLAQILNVLAEIIHHGKEDDESE